MRCVRSTEHELALRARGRFSGDLLENQTEEEVSRLGVGPTVAWGKVRIEPISEGQQVTRVPAVLGARPCRRVSWCDALARVRPVEVLERAWVVVKPVHDARR